MRALVRRLYLVTLWLLLAVGCWGNVRLNLKSRRLSNIFGSSSSKKSDPARGSPSSLATQGTRNTPTPERKTSDLLRLDLSGRLNLLVAGPVEEEPAGRIVRPLLGPSPSSSPLPDIDKTSDILAPSVRMGVDYDFSNSRRWFGVTRVLASLGFKQQRVASLLPGQWLVSVERGLTTDEDEREFYAAQVKAGWQNRRSKLLEASSHPFVKLRLDSFGVGSASCLFPFHRRFRWNGKISRRIFDRAAEVGDRCSIPLPAVASLDDLTWLIPNIRVNALGNMESKNQAWFTSPWQDRLGRLGFRLTVRRRFDWNPLGFAAEDVSESGHNARVRLDVMGATPRSITTLRLETALEEPLASSHLSVLQDFQLHREKAAQ